MSDSIATTQQHAPHHSHLFALHTRPVSFVNLRSKLPPVFGSRQRLETRRNMRTEIPNFLISALRTILGNNEQLSFPAFHRSKGVSIIHSVIVCYYLLSRHRTQVLGVQLEPKRVASMVRAIPRLIFRPATFGILLPSYIMNCERITIHS